MVSSKLTVPESPTPTICSVSQLQFQVELPRTKPTLALESCADFFDRDYDTLAVDVENQVIKFAWDIASRPPVPDDVVQARREIRVYAASAWAFVYNRPMPALTEDEVYKLILPNRDLRSTELKHCSFTSPSVSMPALLPLEAPPWPLPVIVWRRITLRYCS